MTSHDQPSHPLEGDEAPLVAPTSASCGVVQGAAHGRARGEARGRAYGGACGAARGTAPAIDSGVALGASLGATPIVAPPHIDIDALFAFADKEVFKLEQSILSFDDGVYRDICVTICRSLHDLKARFRGHHSFTPDVSVAIPTEHRAEILGDTSFDDVKRVAPKDIIKRDLFPSYEGTQGRVRSYRVTCCVDPIVTSMIYPHLLVMHGHYSNKD